MNGAEEITILAIGGAGCRMMSILRTLPGAQCARLLAVDTDRAALESTGLPPENTLLAGELWRGGRGCGGDELDGQRAVAHERSKLESMLQSTKFLLVICGLGGGTASGGAPVIFSVASKLKIPNMFMAMMPFMLEGYRRHSLAERVLEDGIFDVADTVIALPNDLLFSTLPGDTALAVAFESAAKECATTVLALSTVLAAGNLLNADISSFTSLLKRRKCKCSIGVGVVRGEDEVPPEQLPERLVSGMLASPLLGGPQVLKDADAVVVSILGGEGLTLGEMRGTLGLAGKYFGADTEQLTAAEAHPEWGASRQLCVLAIKYDEAVPPVKTAVRNTVAKSGRTSAAKAPAAAAAGGGEQLSLGFETVSKGIMERTAPVMWEGVDLDEPAFKRHNAVIDDGRKSSGKR